MQKICFSLIFYAWGLVLWPFASRANPPRVYALDSPYATLHTFLNGLEQGSSPTTAAAFMRPGVSHQEAIMLAKRLKAVLDTKGIRIDLDKVPNDPNFRWPQDGEQKYVLAPTVLPNIFLRKFGQIWLFSDVTIHNIDKLYDPLKRLQFQNFGSFFHCRWHRTVVGIALWQYFILIVAGLCTWLSQWAVSLLMRSILRALLILSRNMLVARHFMKYGHKVGWYLGSLVLLSLWLYWLIPALRLPVGASFYLLRCLILWRVIQGIRLGYALTGLVGFYFERGVKEERLVANIDTISLLCRISKSVILLLGILFMINALGVEAKPLVASFGLGSVGVALASQDTFRNLFGSLMIFLDRPFKVGDFIITRDVEGVVEDVGMRSTIVCTTDGSRVYMPNSVLAASNIANRGENTHSRYHNKFTIDFAASPEAVKTFVQEFKAIIANHPNTLKGKSQVALTDIHERGYEVTYTLFFDRADPYKELMYRHNVLLQVMELAQKQGLKF